MTLLWEKTSFAVCIRLIFLVLLKKLHLGQKTAKKLLRYGASQLNYVLHFYLSSSTVNGRGNKALLTLNFAQQAQIHVNLDTFCLNNLYVCSKCYLLLLINQKIEHSVFTLKPPICIIHQNFKYCTIACSLSISITKNADCWANYFFPNVEY